MFKWFYRAERDVFVIKNKKDLLKLVNDVQNGSFNKELIRIDNKSEITDDDLGRLMDAIKTQPKISSSLKTLHIKQELITKMPDSSAIEGLELLFIEGCRFTDVPSLEFFPNLNHLNFTPYDGVICKAPFVNNSKLKYLIFHGINFVGIVDLSGSRALEKLSMIKCGLQILPFIDCFDNLIELNLRGNKINIRVNLNNFKKLSHLDLSYNEMIEPPELGECPLIYLNLSYNPFNRTIDNLPISLSHLNLSNARLRDAPDLTKCKWLNNLDVSKNYLLDVSDLSECVKLKYCDFSGNPLTLMSRVYLTSCKMFNFEYYSFDKIDLYRELYPNVEDERKEKEKEKKDYEFLSNRFKTLSEKERLNLLAESSFENYLKVNYKLSVVLFGETYSLANWETSLHYKILEYLVPPLLNYNVNLLEKSFFGYIRELRIIKKHSEAEKNRNDNITESLINPRVELIRSNLLFKFNRDKNKAAISYQTSSSNLHTGSQVVGKPHNYLPG